MTEAIKEHTKYVQCNINLKNMCNVTLTLKICEIKMVLSPNGIFAKHMHMWMNLEKQRNFRGARVIRLCRFKAVFSLWYRFKNFRKL